MNLFDQVEEKQNKIIHAALEEFAEQGYEKASTNRIVQKAGVGKGMLYYYFNSKRDLYLYLVNESLEIIEKDFISKIDLSERDFFKRFQQIALFKMEVYLKNSHIFNFMSQVFVMESSILPEELVNRIEKLRNEGFSKIYQNLDYSKFKKDVDVNKAIQLIQWAMNGYQNDLINRLKGEDFSNFNFSHYMDDFLEYLEVLKKSFYQ